MISFEKLVELAQKALDNLVYDDEIRYWFYSNKRLIFHNVGEVKLFIYLDSLHYGVSKLRCSYFNDGLYLSSYPNILLGVVNANIHPRQIQLEGNQYPYPKIEKVLDCIGFDEKTLEFIKKPVKSIARNTVKQEKQACHSCRIKTYKDPFGIIRIA